MELTTVARSFLNLSAKSRKKFRPYGAKFGSLPTTIRQNFSHVKPTNCISIKHFLNSFPLNKKLVDIAPPWRDEFALLDTS